MKFNIMWMNEFNIYYSKNVKLLLSTRLKLGKNYNENNVRLFEQIDDIKINSMIEKIPSNEIHEIN